MAALADEEPVSVPTSTCVPVRRRCRAIECPRSDGARALDAGAGARASRAEDRHSLLGTPTGAGRLYDVDVRLRPDGAKGLPGRAPPVSPSTSEPWEHSGAGARARRCVVWWVFESSGKRNATRDRGGGVVDARAHARRARTVPTRWARRRRRRAGREFPAMPAASESVRAETLYRNRRRGQAGRRRGRGACRLSMRALDARRASDRSDAARGIGVLGPSSRAKAGWSTRVPRPLAAVPRAARCRRASDRLGAAATRLACLRARLGDAGVLPDAGALRERMPPCSTLACGDRCTLDRRKRLLPWAEVLKRRAPRSRRRRARRAGVRPGMIECLWEGFSPDIAGGFARFVAAKAAPQDQRANRSRTMSATRAVSRRVRPRTAPVPRRHRARGPVRAGGRGNARPPPRRSPASANTGAKVAQASDSMFTESAVATMRSAQPSRPGRGFAPSSAPVQHAPGLA